MATVSPASPVSVVSQTAYLVENGAGTYQADFPIPAGSMLLDVIVHCEALWTAGTSALLDVGDATTPTGIFNQVNLKATDLILNESISMNGLAGGKHGADLALDYASVATIGASQIKRRLLTAARTITAKCISTGAGTAGRTWVTVLYAPVNYTTVTQ